MKKNKLASVIRVVLALALIFFGLNGFLQFVTPPSMSEAATNFLGALFATGYILPVLNFLFLVIALMLIFNKFVPLALVLLAPFTVNIVLFHFFLDFASGTMGYIVALFNIYLIHVNWDSYRPMWKR